MMYTMQQSLDYFKELLEWKTKDGIYALNVYHSYLDKYDNIVRLILTGTPYKSCENADLLIDAFNIDDEMTMKELYEYEWRYRCSMFHLRYIEPKNTIKVVCEKNMTASEAIDLIKTDISYIFDVNKLITYFDDDANLSGRQAMIPGPERSREVIHMEAIDNILNIHIKEDIKPNVEFLNLEDPLDLQIREKCPELIYCEQMCRYYNELFNNPKFTHINRVCHEIIAKSFHYKSSNDNQLEAKTKAAMISTDEKLFEPFIPPHDNTHIDYVKAFVNVFKRYNKYTDVSYINRLDLDMLFKGLMNSEIKSMDKIALAIEIRHAIQFNHPVRQYNKYLIVRSLADLRHENIVSMNRSRYYYFGGEVDRHEMRGFSDITPLTTDEILKSLQ